MLDIFANYFSLLIKNKKKVFFSFLIFAITFYNYFSVQFFVWDDKDIVFYFEGWVTRRFLIDINFNPRYLEKYLYGLLYYTYQYNYTLYTLTFLILHFLNSLIFWKILSNIFEKKNLFF